MGIVPRELFDSCPDVRPGVRRRRPELTKLKHEFSDLRNEAGVAIRRI